jgi:hypothetical protein
MKHIKLFESMNDEMQSTSFSGGTSITCISSDNGSAVGMLTPQEEKMLSEYMKSNPSELMVQKFSGTGEQGDFVVLTENGEWEYIKPGTPYNPGYGASVFPILGFGQMFVGLSGAETTWMVGIFSEIIKEL